MEKIKQFIGSEKGKDILIVIIIILVGVGSFELGRLSKENSSSGVKILPAQAGEYPNQSMGQATNQTSNVISATKFANSKPSNSIQTSHSLGKNYFASNRGTKYYSLNCSAGKTIKQENKVYFATADEAIKAGYTLSTSCN